MVQKTLLSATPKKLAKSYFNELVSAGITVEKIIIFGSYAKGTAKPWSDLDICVVSPFFGKSRFQEGAKLAKIAHKVDDMIEPHPYNPKDLAEKWDPLAYQIRTTGKIIIDNK